MIRGVCILILFQLLGEAAVSVFQLFVPGQVLGMVLLLFALMIWQSVPDFMLRTSRNLLPYLPMFLVPVCVGIFEYWDLIQRDLAAIIVALVVSLFVSLAVTGLMLNSFVKARRA